MRVESRTGAIVTRYQWVAEASLMAGSGPLCGWRVPAPAAMGGWLVWHMRGRFSAISCWFGQQVLDPPQETQTG